MRVEQAIVRLEGDRLLDHGLHQLLVLSPVLDQVGDGADLEVVLGCKDLELRHPGHGPVVVHDLADDAHGRAARELREVHDPLRLTAAHEHTALTCPERKDMPRARKVGGLGGGVGRDLNRPRAIRGADSGRDPGRRLDRDGERRPVSVGVVRRLHREVEPIADLSRHRGTDEASPFLRHEVDGLRRDLVSEHGEVALVLAVRVIDKDDHAPLAEVVDDLGDRGDGHVGDGSGCWLWPGRRQRLLLEQWQGFRRGILGRAAA